MSGEDEETKQGHMLMYSVMNIMMEAGEQFPNIEEAARDDVVQFVV